CACRIWRTKNVEISIALGSGRRGALGYGPAGRQIAGTTALFCKCLPKGRYQTSPPRLTEPLPEAEPLPEGVAPRHLRTVCGLSSTESVSRSTARWRTANGDRRPASSAT